MARTPTTHIYDPRSCFLCQKARIICDLNRPCIQCKLIGATHMCMGYELNNCPVEQPSRRGDGDCGFTSVRPVDGIGRDLTRRKQDYGACGEVVELSTQDRRYKKSLDEYTDNERLRQAFQTLSKHPCILDMNESRGREVMAYEQRIGGQSELLRAQNPHKTGSRQGGDVCDRPSGGIGLSRQDGDHQSLYLSSNEPIREMNEYRKQQRGDKQRKRQKVASVEVKDYFKEGLVVSESMGHRISELEDKSKMDASSNYQYGSNFTLSDERPEGRGMGSDTLYSYSNDTNPSSHMRMVSYSPASALDVSDSAAHPSVSQSAPEGSGGADDFPMDDQARLNEALVKEVIRLRQDQFKIMQELNFLRDQQDQMIKSAPSLFQLQSILTQLSIGFPPASSQGGNSQQQVTAAVGSAGAQVDRQGFKSEVNRPGGEKKAGVHQRDGSGLNVAVVNYESNKGTGLENNVAVPSGGTRLLSHSSADRRSGESAAHYLSGLSSELVEPSVDSVEATLNMISPMSPFVPDPDTPSGDDRYGELTSVSSLSVFLVEMGIQLAENLQSIMGDDCPIVIFDFTYNMPVIRNTNVAFLNLFGYTQDQVAKMKWRMFICPHYLERTVQILKQACCQKDTFIQFTQVYTDVCFKNFLAMDTHVLLSTQRGGLVDLVIIQPDSNLPCPSIGDRRFQSFKAPLPNRLEGGELVKNDAEQSQQYVRTILSATVNIASVVSRASGGIGTDPPVLENSTNSPKGWQLISKERRIHDDDQTKNATSTLNDSKQPPTSPKIHQLVSQSHVGDTSSNPVYNKSHSMSDGCLGTSQETNNQSNNQKPDQVSKQTYATSENNSSYYHPYQQGNITDFPLHPSEKKDYHHNIAINQSSRDFVPRAILPSSPDYPSFDHRFYVQNYPFNSTLTQADQRSYESQNHLSQHTEPFDPSSFPSSQRVHPEFPDPFPQPPPFSSPLQCASTLTHTPFHLLLDCKQRPSLDSLLPRSPHPYEDPYFFADLDEDAARYCNK